MIQSSLLAFLLGLLTMSLGHAESFRLSLLQEPHTLDPQTTSAAGGNYLFNSIYRGLFRYQSGRGLISEGAKSCTRAPLKLVCQLDPRHKWSDGQPIVAEDYVRAFRRLIDPERKSPQSELLFTLKNARAIWQGQAAPATLGVRAPKPTTLEFDFAEEDFEFEYKLIAPAAAPWPSSELPEREKGAQLLVSGPYKITEWKIGHHVHLEANPNYGLEANPKRPPLEIFFLDNDTTALRLFESGKLNFLRRLTAGEIPRFKGKPEFHQIPIARFDYVGFGPSLNAHPHLRAALLKSVDYATFMALFDTQSPPGCPSLPARLLDHETCMVFAPTKAKAELRLDSDTPKLEFQFSKMGGDDISRAAEWFQGQWKRNLDLHVELKSQEQTGYLQELRVSPPTIFRKGVSLERPTCLAALELFSKDSRENYLKINDAGFEKHLKKLRSTLSEPRRRVACRQAVEYLFGLERMIPLGQMYFTLLASPKFSGWSLNELNQLDLTDLNEKL